MAVSILYPSQGMTVGGTPRKGYSIHFQNSINYFWKLRNQFFELQKMFFWNFEFRDFRLDFKRLAGF